MAFEGFSKETLAFIGDLAAHNDRDWFAANKKRYEHVVLGPEKAFVGPMGDALAQISPGVVAEAAVNGSIFRINRDTRFSHDKSPYKTHVDMRFWVGPDKKAAPGYFVRLTADKLWIGAGAHVISDAGLARLRKAIAADETGQALVGILDRLRDLGYAIGEEAYKRVPAGYPTDHPRADLLRFGSLHAMKPDLTVPPEFYTAAFVEWCAKQFAECAPLVDWMAEVL